jgi:hypothetical protein
MCLKIETTFRTRTKAREFYSKPLIAKTNITVYKVLENYGNQMVSPHRSVVYKFDELKKVKSFSSEIMDEWNRCWKIRINRGLHSYNAKQIDLLIRRYQYNHYSIIKCKIPKGSKYFKNEEEYVSLALQMPKK